MEKTSRFCSVNDLNRCDGVPVTMVRREIKQGIVSGFYSGNRFHIDREAYLALLLERKRERSA